MTTPDESNKAANRGKWAAERLAKMSAQTQTDIAEIVKLLSVDGLDAADKFNELARARDWKLWEAAAIKDVIIALRESTKHDGTTASGSFEPVYTPWRHGGWYVVNVRYSSGAVGCVSRNYPDGKWRIVCDPAPFEKQTTFPTRDAAAMEEHKRITQTIVTP